MSAQTREHLLLDDESLPLVGEPLAPWLARERLQVAGDTGAACRRGYVGTWRLCGTRLCLVSLVPAADGAHLRRERDERPIEISLARLFGSARPVWADWFSGQLRCPRLPCLRYSDYGIPQPAQHDLVVELVAGRAQRIGFECLNDTHEASAVVGDAAAAGAATSAAGGRWPWPLPEWAPAMRRWHLLPHRPAH